MIIREKESLRALNTFDIDVYADYFAEIYSSEDLQEILEHPVFHRHDSLILGGGSNILFLRNYEGLIIKNEIRGIEVLREDKDSAWLKVGSGEIWHDFVLYTLNRNYFGLENLSLIPGTVGAAPIQNIGAYGVELKDFFHSLTAINLLTGREELFKKADCGFGYRDSIFKHEAKNKYFITSVTLQLRKAQSVNIDYGNISDVLRENNITTPTPQDVSNAVISIRKSKLPDPNQLGNAGSFFKNPIIQRPIFEILKMQYPDVPYYDIDQLHVKVPAGWLVEQCGWKGKQFGNVGVHNKQALVLVNFSNATGKEVYNLSQDITASVLEKFGIELEREVNVY